MILTLNPKSCYRDGAQALLKREREKYYQAMILAVSAISADMRDLGKPSDVISGQKPTEQPKTNNRM